MSPGNSTRQDRALHGATGVAYIAGNGHSGSTLLDVLLNAHPSIVGLGEAHRLSLQPWTRVCADGLPIMRSPFWRPVVEQVCDERGIDVARWENSMPTTQADEGLRKRLRDAALVLAVPRTVGVVGRIPVVDSYLRAVRNSLEFYESAASVAGGSWVVDSTKNPMRMKALSLLRPSHLRVIHLVRDPRSVAASAARRQGTGVRDSTRNWVRVNARVRWLCRSMRVPSLVVRYEDLTRNPGRTIHKTISFLGLEMPKSGLRMDTQRHQIPGNNWLVDNPHGTIEVREDRRWITQLTAVDRAVVERIGRRDMARYDYNHAF